MTYLYDDIPTANMQVSLPRYVGNYPNEMSVSVSAIVRMHCKITQLKQWTFHFSLFPTFLLCICFVPKCRIAHTYTIMDVQFNIISGSVFVLSPHPVSSCCVAAALQTERVLHGVPAQSEDLLQEVDDDDTSGVLPSAGDKAAQVSHLCRAGQQSHSLCVTGADGNGALTSAYVSVYVTKHRNW